MSNHHGEILERILRTKNINITVLAKEIGVSKQTIYNWFDAVSISDDRWDQIGKAINYDFSKDIPALKNPYRGSPVDIARQIVEEEYEVYSMSQKVNISVDLNGDDRLLNHVIQKLTKINEALKI